MPTGRTWERRDGRIKLLVSLVLAAIVVVVAVRQMPAPTLVTSAPSIISPSDGVTLGADELRSFEGQTDPGVTLQVLDGSEPLGRTVSASDGSFTLKLNKWLEVGSHVVRAVVVDWRGREVATSDALAFTVVPPLIPVEAPQILSPAAGSTVVDGQSVMLSGSADPGATVRIYDGQTLLDELTVDDTGHWAAEVGGKLAVGDHRLIVVALDRGGYEAATSPSFPVSISRGAVDTVLSWPAEGDTLQAHDALSLVGVAAPAATVRLYDGDAVMGEAEAGQDGSWSINIADPLTPGDHSLRAVALDSDGAEGSSSKTVRVTVAKPEQKLAILGSASSATVNTEQIFLLRGTAPAGADLRIEDGGQMLAEITANDEGMWSFAAPSSLSPGLHELRVVQLNEDGAAAGATGVFELTIEELIVTPLVTAPADGSVIGLGQGIILQGTAAPWAVVRLYASGTLIGEVAADAEGSWEYEVPQELPSGKHELWATVLNFSGSEAETSDSVTVSVGDLGSSPWVAGMARGASFAAGDPLRLQGTAAPGSTVRLYDGETSLGSVGADESGAWSIEIAEELELGLHTLSAVALDADDEETDSSGSWQFAIAGEGMAPVIFVQGLELIPAGGAITGAASPSARIMILGGGIILGTISTDEQGWWEFVLPSTMRGGDHSIRAVQLNEVGERVGASELAVVTIRAVSTLGD
jgi:hypothetical protein